MITLGINGVSGIFHDASATIIKDGQLIASVEEERFNRNKHSNGIPFQAIEYCLESAGIDYHEIDNIGYYLQPDVLLENMYNRMISEYGAEPEKVRYIQEVSERISSIPSELSKYFKVDLDISPDFKFLNHHLCHAASAYYPSNYQRAAVLVIDGSGDRESISLYKGEENKLEKVHDFMIFPQSLGFIYSMFSAHLGLGSIEGPGKLMGLSAYGNDCRDLVEDLVSFNDDPYMPVTMHLEHFSYHTGHGDFSDALVQRFGPARKPEDELTEFHRDIAASIQSLISDAIMHIFRQIPVLLPDEKNLCYAGGLALNVLTNRRMHDEKLFDEIFITPAAYDGGCSLGAAYYLHSLSTPLRIDPVFMPYFGPDTTKNFDLPSALERFSDQIDYERLDDRQLFKLAASDLACKDHQMIVGWVQGSMELGPRALGNRSMLTSPINKDSKYELDRRVKKREGFRPYAPSVLEEHSSNWFDLEYSPYMLLEAKVHEDKRDRVPGIVHVDGSARPQTVNKNINPRYYQLISEFYNITSVPVILNTSFNRHGEPITNTPEEAILVLLETDLDVLYIENWRITKKNHAQ